MINTDFPKKQATVNQLFSVNNKSLSVEIVPIDRSRLGEHLDIENFPKIFTHSEKNWLTVTIKKENSHNVVFMH